MTLTKLTLADFGVFQGVHTLELSPRPRKPVVILGGKNGAGKTTVLEAIKLCLHGSTALGLRTSKEEYLKYLGSKIHSNPNNLIQPTSASVALEFQYADVDALHTYEVVRSWQRRPSNKIVEDLRVSRDGRLIDEVSAEHWQDFIRELIPPGLVQFFFFDGEKIQQLAEDSSDQQALADSIKTMLGLDLVERLAADLTVYTSRLAKSTNGHQGPDELSTLQNEIHGASQKVQAAQNDYQHLQDTLGRQQASVAEIEQRIASAGGAFARNRHKLLKQQAQLSARIKQIEDSIRQTCAGLLPFAIVPDLCLRLRQQLQAEEQSTQAQAGLKLLQSARKDLLRELSSADLWKELGKLPKAHRNRITKRLVRVLDSKIEASKDKTENIHSLSHAVQDQLLRWIDQATLDLPKSMQAASNELESLYRDLHKVESSLRKVPADEVLKPLAEELGKAHQRMAECAQQAIAKEQQITTLENMLRELERKRAALTIKLATDAAHGSKLKLIPRVQEALEEYKEAMLQKKIAHLQDSVTDCFAALCRKKDGLKKITISPTDFSVTLFDKRSRMLPKAQLSAGEKQIYAISMLWALAKTSGRPLPIIIDTPLARLDSDHRKLLIKHYFPAASHQVLLLSTDTEVDQSYFGALQKFIARAYRLEFDQKESCTVVKSGYFW